MKIPDGYTWDVSSAIRIELQKHDFFPWIPMQIRKYTESVGKKELYDTLLSPKTSHYINLAPCGVVPPPGLNVKSLMQVEANFATMMSYTLYSGYLYASIWKDDRYDKNVWTYQYMHKKLDGNIYGPFLISLIPQIFNQKVNKGWEDLYIPESCQIFSMVLKIIGSSVTLYKIDNSNLYFDVDKNSSFYKDELPACLYAMHELGSSLYFSSYGTRIEGKNLMSRNLWGNLNLLSPQSLLMG